MATQVKNLLKSNFGKFIFSMKAFAYYVTENNFMLIPSAGDVLKKWISFEDNTVLNSDKPIFLNFQF